MGDRYFRLKLPVRIMAHEILIDGETLKMSVVEIDTEHNLRTWEYDGDTHSTVFINGRICLRKDAVGWFYIPC